ncbi:MAG: hypothetical protein JXR70_00480 [Spirochaetales bacterium]|nr:hypothetical protein [Spirochaetales bacterium]
MKAESYHWTHYFKLYVFPFIDESDFHEITDALGPPTLGIEKIISLLILGGALHQGWEQLNYLALDNRDIQECLSLTKNQAALFHLDYASRFFDKLQRYRPAKEAFLEIIQRFITQCGASFPKMSSNPEELFQYLSMNHQYSLFCSGLEQFYQELQFKNIELFDHRPKGGFDKAENGAVNQIALDSLFAEIKWIVSDKTKRRDYQELSSFRHLRKLYVQYGHIRAVNFIKNQNFIETYLKKFQKPVKSIDGEVPLRKTLEVSKGTSVLVAAIVLGLVHLFITASIAFQPLSVNAFGPEKRSLVWGLYNESVHRIGPGAGFFSFYYASKAIAADKDIYGREELKGIPGYGNVYTYLPAFAQIIGPFFSILKPQQAYQLWILTMEILLVILLVLIWFRSPQWWVRLSASALMFLSTPLFLEIHMGGFSFASTALLAIALLLPRETKKWFTASIQQISASLLISLSFMVNPALVISLPALIKRKRYWMGLILGLMTLLVLNLPYFMTHPEAWENFITLNFRGLGNTKPFETFSLLHIIEIIARQLKATDFLSHFTSFASNWQFMVLLFSAIMVLLSRYKRPSLGLSLMILGYFLASPKTTEFHLSAALIMGILMLSALTAEPKSRNSPIYLGFTLAALIVLTLPSLFVFLDRVKDVSLYEVTTEWSFFRKFMLSFPKVIATLGLYLIALMKMTSMGLKLPWQEYRKKLQPREHGIF